MLEQELIIGKHFMAQLKSEDDSILDDFYKKQLARCRKKCRRCSIENSTKGIDMHWSTTETKRVAVCLFLSALLHLAVVLLTPSTPDPQPAFEVVFRQPPRTLETRVFDPTKPALHERQMQRLVVKAAPLQLAQEPAESAPLDEIAEQLPPEFRDVMAHLEKRIRIERSGDVNIDSLLLAFVAAEGNFRRGLRALSPGQGWVQTATGPWRWSSGRLRLWACRQRLLEIRAMSAMVWLESNVRDLKRPSCQGGVCLKETPVTPYLYPVATCTTRMGRSRCLHKRKISAMKIRDIDTILIDSPGRKWTIVRVFTDEGLVGLGEATYSPKGAGGSCRGRAPQTGTDWRRPGAHRVLVAQALSALLAERHLAHGGSRVDERHERH